MLCLGPARVTREEYPDALARYTGVTLRATVSRSLPTRRRHSGSGRWRVGRAISWMGFESGARIDCAIGQGVPRPRCLFRGRRSRAWGDTDARSSGTPSNILACGAQMAVGSWGTGLVLRREMIVTALERRKLDGELASPDAFSKSGIRLPWREDARRFRGGITPVITISRG